METLFYLHLQYLYIHICFINPPYSRSSYCIWNKSFKLKPDRVQVIVVVIQEVKT